MNPLNHGSGARRRPVLLTGASGVVGTALRSVLAPWEYVALVHRRPLPGSATVTGDIRAERLGLDRSAYAELVSRIGGIVHAAADTRLNGAAAQLDATNVAGTRTLLRLATDANVPLYYVSTAFVHALTRPENAGRVLPYAESKAAAEESIRVWGGDHVVLRPSIVVGDSGTGVISEFQGLHRICGAILSDLFPAFPSDESGLVDFVPQDLVARVIAAAVRGELPPGTCEAWITAGHRAMPLEQLIAELVALAAEAGRPIAAPRIVSADLYERLVKPVFLGALPEELRRKVTALFEHVAPYIAVRSPFPESPAVITAAGGADADPGEVLRRTMRHWMSTTGHLGGTARLTTQGATS
ncbi:SDR family oxidoreductase [Kitasatospora sp. NPDC048296]|uniref:SDR family oxidoreductase n=1 Tax=Kitasatospora sp. NPDC048296 TaxID=3364048 RepID=UPI00371F2EB0